MAGGLLILSLLVGVQLAAARFADVVVYAATPGGITAAIASARHNLSVVLLEPTQHVGGMSASGLGATDTGNASVIGGIALEFFTRNGRYYNSTKPEWHLEPHVAEAIFLEMLGEARVAVVYGQQVASVGKQGTTLQQLTTVDGSEFTGSIFIDASYEGDVLARAGVSYTYGRESNTTYNEPLAGRMAYSPKNQFYVRVDPYAADGTLLAMVAVCGNGSDPTPPGHADKKIEAYNFRLCLTKNPPNRVPFTAPPGYDPTYYELVARYAAVINASGRTPVAGDFLGNMVAIPGVLKYDCNNGGALSTDYICGSVEYPEAGYAQRRAIWLAHYNYTMGLLYHLSTADALPASLRREMQTLGLCADEFADNGHWPWQLYVREARRMVGGTVFTEHTARARVVAGDASVGVGGYHFDSHNVQRLACANGTMHCNPEAVAGAGAYVLNEGDLQVDIPPFEIPYSAMLPLHAEATNLLVPVAASSSHVGFLTLRLEPTWMIMGHSAGTAAALALRTHVPVQDIDRARLEDLLEEEHQIVRV